MYANKKLLADNGFALPKTYADLKAMVPKLKAKGIQVITLPDGDGWQMQSCLFSTVVGRMLGDGWVDQAMTGKTQFTEPGVRRRPDRSSRTCSRTASSRRRTCSSAMVTDPRSSPRARPPSLSTATGARASMSPTRARAQALIDPGGAGNRLCVHGLPRDPG